MMSGDTHVEILINIVLILIVAVNLGEPSQAPH